MNALEDSPQFGDASNKESGLTTMEPLGFSSVFKMHQGGNEPFYKSDMLYMMDCDDNALRLQVSPYTSSTYSLLNNISYNTPRQEVFIPEPAFCNAPYSIFDTAHYIQANNWQKEQNEAFESTHLSPDCLSGFDHQNHMQIENQEIAYLRRSSSGGLTGCDPSSIAGSEDVESLSRCSELLLSPSTWNKQTLGSLSSQPQRPQSTKQPASEPVATTSPEKPPRVIKRRYRKKKILTEEQTIAKRNAFLNRNREAASKCRTKKNLWMYELAESAKSAKMENDILKVQYFELTEEIKVLRCAISIIEAGAPLDLKQKAVKEGEQVVGSGG